MKEAKQILEQSDIIAVVGASRDRHKPSHWVPKMMQRHGWRIIPVNPHAHEILGEHAYARLKDIPEHVDLVDIFRPPEEAARMVQEAIAIGARAIWLQLGITCPEGRDMCHEAGIDYIENDCMGIERTLACLVHRKVAPAGAGGHPAA